MTLLTGEYIKLRAIEPEDLEFLYECENNTNIWLVSNTFTPYSKYVLKQYIENSHYDIYTNKQLRLIIVLKNNRTKIIGAIDLFDFDPYHLRAGIGILINDVTERQKGYAKEALNILIEYCFNHLKLKQLFCNIGASNNKSIQLFEKAGFIKCGEKKYWLRTDKGFESEFMYQLINSPI